MSKLTLKYKISPLEDEVLKKHLFEALKKNLIYMSKFFYGAIVFFIKKKDSSLHLVTDTKI